MRRNSLPRRPPGQQPPDFADVVDGFCRRKAVAIAWRKSLSIAARQRHAGFFAVMGEHRLAEGVLPGADELADLVFEQLRIGLGPHTGIAADDEMHPREIFLVERR